MYLRRLAVALVLILALVSFPRVGVAAAGDGRSGEHEAGQILVKFKDGTSESDRTESHRRHGGRVLETIPGIDVQVVGVEVGKEKGKRDEYRGDPRVTYAEVDGIAEAIASVNDPLYGSQWGMAKIQTSEAWDLTTGSATVKIAILDTGIDQDHEDLRSKIVANRNFTKSRTVDDKYGHGTHVAGIAAASTNNGVGVAGVGYSSTLMNVKVLGDNGTGSYSWIAGGIVWATDNGAKVINMSLGGSTSSSTLESAVNYAWSNGVVLVAAAGNSDTSTALYPAYYANVIAVAATNSNDAKAGFSSYGDWVDIAAPGVDILSTLPNHSNRIGPRNYGYLSGTSMAAPFVAGVAALVSGRYPSWTNAEVKARVLSATDPTTGFSTALGRVNALKAVQ